MSLHELSAAAAVSIREIPVDAALSPAGKKFHKTFLRFLDLQARQSSPNGLGSRRPSAGPPVGDASAQTAHSVGVSALRGDDRPMRMADLDRVAPGSGAGGGPADGGIDAARALVEESIGVASAPRGRSEPRSAEPDRSYWTHETFDQVRATIRQLEGKPYRNELIEVPASMARGFKPIPKHTRPSTPMTFSRGLDQESTSEIRYTELLTRIDELEADYMIFVRDHRSGQCRPEMLARLNAALEKIQNLCTRAENAVWDKIWYHKSLY